MKKFIVMILSAALLLLSFASCGKLPEEPAEKTAVRVIALKGPTGIGLSSLMAEDEKGTTANDYSFTLASAPTEVSPAVISGNFDIAALPVNLASVLYNKGAEIEFLAVNTLGVLYILENGNTVNSVADLRGKTVYATGEGSTPQYVLEYVLEKNGMKVGDDVTVEYFSDHAELASKLAANTVAIGMLPEPNVTSALLASKDGLRVALDLTAEWEKVGEGTLVQGVIVVSKAFLKNNGDAVSAFLEEYGKSVGYVNTNAKEASVYCETYGIIPKAAVAEKAIPNCNICCEAGDIGKELMKNMLSVLFSANPASVGGKLPDDGFYGEK